MGSLYKRGSIWWIKYYYRGKPIKEICKESEEGARTEESRIALMPAELPIMH